MPAVLWLLIAVGLCVGEVLTLDLILLMLAGAALAGGGTALVTDSFTAQAAVTAVVAVALLAGVRPLARRHLEVPALAAGPARLRGRRALVVEAVGPDSGQVRVDGELWRARPFAVGPELPPGSAVVIASVEGATLHVYPEELA